MNKEHLILMILLCILLAACSKHEQKTPQGSMGSSLVLGVSENYFDQKTPSCPTLSKEDEEIYRWRKNIEIKTAPQTPYETDGRIPVYRNLRPENFIGLKKHPENYARFMANFNYADEDEEALLYELVAINWLGVNRANLGVAQCLTEWFYNPLVGKHSSFLALHYLKKWRTDEKMERRKNAYIKDLQSDLLKDCGFLYSHKIYYNSPLTEQLKRRCLNGSISDYEHLKARLYKKDLYVFLFYYAYIMADRYDYTPAKKDILAIIKRFYRECGIDFIDKDTQYFCSIFG